MARLYYALIFGFVLFLLSSCAEISGRGGLTHQEAMEAIVHAQAFIKLSPAEAGNRMVVDQTVPISVVESANSKMNISTANFSVPQISNAVLDFGTLQITSLIDNDLQVCGNNGNQKCSTALIRLYTMGEAGAGLWNSVDNYGAPLTASLTSPLSVGLNVANAAVMQTFSIPANKHVVNVSDFSPAPNYDIQVDFSNAGAGSYATTLVVEYALAP